MWLLTSDFHIGALLHKQGSRPVKDSEVILSQLVSVVKEKGIKCVVAAGDIFHKARVKKEEIKIFREFVANLSGHGCCFMYIPGNHEKEDLDNPDYSLPEAINPEAADITGQWVQYGHTVVGIPEDTPGVVREKIRESPACDLLVVHAPFKHLFNAESAPSLEDVPARVKNVLAGHIHVKDKTCGLLSGGCVFSAGPLHATEVKQMGMLGGWLTDDPGNPDKYEWIGIADQKVVSLEVDQHDKISDKVSEINKELEKNKGRIPLTIEFKYVPEARNTISNISREFNNNPDIRFIRTAVPSDSDLKGISETVTEEDTEGFTKKLDVAFREEIPEDEKEVREFLWPMVKGDVPESREYIRNWLRKQGVEKISV